MPIEVTALASDGRTFTTRTVDGDVYLPDLPVGRTQFIFQSIERSTLPKTVELDVPAVDEQIFDINLIPRGQSAQVERVWFANVSPLVLRVGETAKLQFRYQGTGVNGVAPSLWIEGGVGSLNPGGVFRAMAPGVGKANGDLFGVVTTLDIIVTE